MTTGIHAIIRKIHLDAELDSTGRYNMLKENIDAKIKEENATHKIEFEKQKEALLKHNSLEYARMLERTSSRLSRDLIAYQYELISEILDMAVTKLRNITSEEFKKRVSASVKGIKGGFVMTLGELSETKLTAADIEEIVKNEDGLQITLSDRYVPGKSGYLLKDGRVEYNCLFEDIIDDIKAERTAELMKEVFE